MDLGNKSFNKKKDRKMIWRLIDYYYIDTNNIMYIDNIRE